jgi:YHS domain-containing protein
LGFVILDTPLLAHQEPEGDEDDLTGTDVQERFYQYLLERTDRQLIVVLKNEDPPAGVKSQSQPVLTTGLIVRHAYPLSSAGQSAPCRSRELALWRRLKPNFISRLRLRRSYRLSGKPMNQARVLFAISLLVAAGSGAAETLQYATENGAIDGFDPVSYFSENRAERGSPDFTATWNGAVWHFTTREHRDLFVSDPERYAPQYGGFCALGMAHGGDVPTNPEAWTIWNGKLYLNMIKEVSITWRYNPDKLIARADEKWAAMNARASGEKAREEDEGKASQ